MPIVPIVFRNTGDLMPRESTFIKPGTVDVRVLEPISTDGWTKADVASQADALQKRTAEIVADWPGES